MLELIGNASHTSVEVDRACTRKWIQEAMMFPPGFSRSEAEVRRHSGFDPVFFSKNYFVKIATDILQFGHHTILGKLYSSNSDSKD